ALTPERSASSLIFSRRRSPCSPFTSPASARARAALRASPAVALTSASSHLEGDVLGRAGCAGNRPIGQQLGDLLRAVAGAKQHLLGVLAQRRSGQARVIARRALELDREAEQPHGALGAGLVDLDDHLALAHEL